MVLVRVYNQQFQGTSLLIVFDAAYMSHQLTAQRSAVERQSFSVLHWKSHRFSGVIRLEFEWDHDDSPPKTKMSPKTWWLEDEISFWNGPDFRDMLILGSVII